MHLFRTLLLILVPLIAFSAEPVPFDLRYPTATESSKLKDRDLTWGSTIAREGHCFLNIFQHIKMPK